MFDTFTLVMVLALVHFLVTGLICLAWTLAPKIPGVKFWAYGRIFTSVALIAVALKDRIPFEIAIIVSQSLFFIGQYYVWQGSVLYKGLQQADLRWVGLCFLLSISVVAVAVFSQYDGIRLTVSSLMVIVFSSMNAWVLWQPVNGRRFTACRVVAVMLWLHAAFFIFRMTFAIAHQANQEWIPIPVVQQITFLEAIIATILIGMGYVVLIAERLQYELQNLADHDSLTGILVRRAFFKKAQAVLQTQQQTAKSGVACMVLDLDHFKVLNDKFGHIAGDDALKHAVNVMQSKLRDQDILARIGGEEFILFLPETDNLEANRIAESIRSNLEQSECLYGDCKLEITVSIGLVSYTMPASTITIEKLFEEADKALYEAKSLGRNQVIDYHHDSRRLATVGKGE